MPASLLTPPATEPLSLAEAKAFLRIAHDDDDAVIASLISAARGQVEALARRALITQVWRVALDAWPTDGRIVPRIGPLRDVIAARVFDAAGNALAVDVGRFLVSPQVDAIHAPNWSLPVPGRDRAGIELDIEIGFGSAADVPELLRQAVRALLGHWYENRGLIAIGGHAPMPAGIATMIASYRTLSL